MRDRTLRERLGDIVTAAAGETSTAVGADAPRGSFLVGYTIPREVISIVKRYAETLSSTMEGCIIKAPEAQQEGMLLGILAEAGMLCPRPELRLLRITLQVSRGEVTSRGQREKTKHKDTLGQSKETSRYRYFMVKSDIFQMQQFYNQS
jgi:hypothetical protein